MDTTTIILFSVSFALLVFYIFARRSVLKNIKNLDSNEFGDLMRKGQLIDVRTPDEFKSGHILGARNIPLNRMKQSLKAIRKDQAVFLYCQSGKRSKNAATYLYSQGYENLYNLKGGFNNWDGKTK
jgi:rhodanese-related sulfurtransferase